MSAILSFFLLAAWRPIPSEGRGRSALATRVLFWLIGMLVLGTRVILGQSIPPDMRYREFEVLTCDVKLGQIYGTDLAIHRDGRVLLAAKQGLAIYDGERWELFRHPEDQSCLSVGVDSQGRILVGYSSDFGILQRHADGNYAWESLVGRYDRDGAVHSPCIRILSLGEQNFFGCLNGVAVWTPESSEAFTYHHFGDQAVANSYWVADQRLFVAGQLPNHDLQILRYEDHHFKLHGLVSAEVRPKAFIVGGCDHLDGKQLIATFNEGLYFLTESGLQAWASEVSEISRKIFVKGICRCDDETLAIVGERGIVFADLEGRVIDYLRSTEIEEIGICRNATYVEHEKRLWIPTRGVGNAICFDMNSVNYRWKTRVLGPWWAYEGSSGNWIGGTGPIRFFSREGEPAEFDVTQSLDFLEAEDELLISSIRGLQVAKMERGADASAEGTEEDAAFQDSKKGRELTSIPAEGVSRFLTCGEWLPGKTIALFATFGDGIHWYRRSESESEAGWKFGGHLIDAPTTCFDMEWEPQHQQLWFTLREGLSQWHVGRIPLDPEHLTTSLDIRHYHEVVTGYDRSLAIWRGDLLFLARDGLRVYNADTDRFERLQLSLMDSLGGGQIEAFEVDSDDQLWVHVAGEGLYRIDRDGVGDMVYPAVSGVSRIQCLENSDHLFLISNHHGLVKIPRHRRVVSTVMPELNRLEARPFFSANPAWYELGLGRPTGFMVEYSARSPSLHPMARYQYRIVGWNPEWSRWTNESRQALQSLPPGDYQFEVRCQSKSLQAGPTRSIRLFVPTPWYSRWWARMLAGMMLAGGMSAMISWRIRAERSRADQLERKVRERTSQLSDAKNELEDRVRSRTQDLEIVNQQLREEIEQRHQVEVHLHDSEQRYRTIVEVQSDMIVRFDRSGAITFANQAYSRQQTAGDGCVEGSLFSRGMEAAVAQTLEEWIGSIDCFKAPLTFRHSILRNGETVWEDWKVHALQDPGGAVVGFQGVGRDVSTLVKTQENLRQKEEYLRHGSRLSMLGEMVASITHELRQPLGSISNFAFASEQSLLGVDSDRARQLAKWNQQIVEQIARADSIVRRLRGFARRSEAEMESCDVNQVVADSLDMLQFELRRGEVEVLTEFGEGLPIVRFVRVQLEQVLVNLIRNACDAMLVIPAAERRLVISTTREEGEIWVRVRDSGPGVAESQRSQIFEPFHTTKPDGLGLGLAISRSIVEDGRGKIWLEPSERGASFVFTLAEDSDEKKDSW